MTNNICDQTIDQQVKCLLRVLCDLINTKTVLVLVVPVQIMLDNIFVFSLFRLEQIL